MIGNGLPSYTLPPSDAPAGLPPTSYGTPRGTPYRGFPSSPENIEMTQPVRSGTPNPTTYGNPPTTPVSPTSGGDLPQQRGQAGTVYSTGGYPAIDMTMPVSDPVENSGSLTGHILAQGWYDAPVDQRRSNLKVVIAMLAVLGLLVTVSLVFIFTAGDAFTDFVGNLTGK
ncbi:hypothetical protein [Actinoplanes sp. NPDC049802]|uniref:hypothetical protein n=1 Tax=Actinoplanes sp. NPDC049802 TaxID=3154742 RepID=UPI0034007009